MTMIIASPTVHPSAPPGGPEPHRPSAPAPVADTNQAPARMPARATPAKDDAPPSAESVRALREALSEATQVLQRTAQGLEFSLDKDLGRTVVKVIDSQTREVLRQIPDTEVLHMAKAIDKMRGLLVRMVA